MLGIIGKKVGMTSIFNEDGKNIACTVIHAEPNVVTQLRSVDNDGYRALQISAGERKEKNTTAALKGHFAKAKTTPKAVSAEFKDFRSDVDVDIKLGDTIGVDIFHEGEFVDVISNSKGKGFQGVVKRHGFAGVEVKHTVSTTEVVHRDPLVRHPSHHVYSKECEWRDAQVTTV